MSIQYSYSAGKYYAMYWSKTPTHSMVNGVFFNIELWYRYSFGIGWGGAALTVLAFITSLLADLTNTRNYN